MFLTLSPRPGSNRGTSPPEAGRSNVSDPKPTPGIEPGNLVLTKDALYQLSYMGIPINLLNAFPPLYFFI